MSSALKFALVATCGGLALSGCSAPKRASADPNASASAAAVTVPKPPAGDADANASAFLAAAEPFETLTKEAPSAPPSRLDKLIADAKKAAAGISPALGAARKSALETHLAAVDVAHKGGDRTGVALAAVEGYRTLVESANDTGKVPTAVSLLDYSGFRYQADLSAKPVRWDDMAQAVAFAQGQWNSIASRVTDTALKAEFDKSVADMTASVKAKNAKGATASSTHELDLVDKLEGFFSK